jgi:arylsulfatase A-like enzyme
MPGLPYLPDLPVVKEELAAFHQSIAGMDAAVGRVLDALAESGQAEETLVLFTADHGAPFPRAKATLYDAGLKVPAVWSWPGRLPAGRTWEGLASNVDVVPTLLDLFGLARPADAPGRSWAPVLRGEDQPGREAVFGSVLYDVTYDPVHCVRTERHKYIRSYAVDPAEAAGIDPDVAPVFRGGRWVRVDDYDVLSSRTWAALEGSAPPPVVEELYDLEADPYEEHNLAPAPAAAATLAGMRRRLEAFRARTGSPLGRAHIPPPPKQREAARKLRPAPLPGGDHG